ncbi:tRNA-Thr(GGU) m(6)t(6)A37 methyltransferase TsaA [Acididesulfobacillus acetoxydans]|uniref:Uncharacterized domain UPF0066, YaeB-like domain n=1 Tax=Acididesulfobacillus acetoxydans TaxID=1561005 RepID=A0A8S0Y2D2_9FIRM|nr:tRNA (N6-threonylcarbamoyladenosine(37)-N6)-methyltransferase TrmO [Acididesulfobacillus acetoxydans]CAA7600645.1 tRNA-Thr(GGU) m(6)t(6)A37 methyltransferase TsaA [Acididesulfobacillus acetoxydans]CEJ09426.1 Uncharacterised domain UPF0066, YaeB-like domain [Acididesulfobacillus acetoxydans]
MGFELHPIGTIHTPYFSLNAPPQPNKNASGEFWLSLDEEYVPALERLESYTHIYVLFYMDKAAKPNLTADPPWAPGVEVGLFASRSPHRPNPIGLSIVEVKEISGNEIVISGIDVFNGTPLLDIKPYIHALDCKEDANDGWLDDLADKDHLLAHLLGLEHEHSHDHEHPHDHAHPHDHDHPHDHPHDHEHPNDHAHPHDHGHPHDHEHPQTQRGLQAPVARRPNLAGHTDATHKLKLKTPSQPPARDRDR